MAGSVLVVEPYADLRAGIASALRRRHYACDAVATPDDAALMLRDHDYACVVVDVDVPGSTTEFVSSLSEESSIILITDGDSCDMRDSVHPMLRKPFGGEELIAIVERRRTVRG